MAETPLIPRVRLGTQGLEVSKLGFGCMGLTGAYNSPLDDDAGIAVIAHAFRRGVTFFDTSDVYGPHTNETLLGKALKQLPREQVQVATKFGIHRDTHGTGTVCGRPEYVRACCEASLRRLGVDHIDLYYQHRIDTTIPIEDTIGELKKLVEEGKVKYIGLSEASPDTIRRAHAVHPITAVQMVVFVGSRHRARDCAALQNWGLESFLTARLPVGFSVEEASQNRKGIHGFRRKSGEEQTSLSKNGRTSQEAPA